MKSEQDIANVIKRHLDRSAENLPEQTLAKLAQARQRALAQHRAHGAQGKLQPELAWAGGHRFGTLFSAPRLWAATAVIALALMLLLNSTGKREEPASDANLFVAELPINAYLDSGFEAWLERSSQH